jgi:hypothetical protein
MIPSFARHVLAYLMILDAQDVLQSSFNVRKAFS